MKKSNLQIKKIVLNGIITLGILTFGCCVYNSCIASETQLSYMEHSGNEYSEFEQYINLTRTKIKNNWYPPTSSYENSAIVGLTINKNGQLVKCAIIKPSPSEGFNNSLIEAVKKTKYMPLPKDFIDNSIDLSFEFGMQRRQISK